VHIAKLPEAPQCLNKLLLLDFSVWYALLI